MIEIPRTAPPPGSTDAIIRRCSCPILDNNHGDGAYWVDGKPMFWISGGCPVHDPGGEPDCRLKAYAP
jgi:hypothetical protein